MSKKDEQPQGEYEDEGEKRFTESVMRFADAFLALTEEEQAELIAYTEERCEKAREEYEKRTGNK